MPGQRMDKPTRDQVTSARAEAKDVLRGKKQPTEASDLALVAVLAEVESELVSRGSRLVARGSVMARRRLLDDARD